MSDALLFHLQDCSNSLRSINRRINEYLDRVEADLDAPPTIRLVPEMLTEAEIEKVCPSAEGYGDPAAICGACFRETEVGENCEHARLCAGCAPCDQCEL